MVQTTASAGIQLQTNRLLALIAGEFSELIIRPYLL